MRDENSIGSGGLIVEMEKPEKRKRIYRTDGSYYLVPLSKWLQYVKQFPHSITAERAIQREDKDLEVSLPPPRTIQLGKPIRTRYYNAAIKDRDEK